MFRWGILSTAKIAREQLIPAIVDADNGEVLYCRQLVHAAVQAHVFVRDGNGPRQQVTFPRALADYPVTATAALPPGFPDGWVIADSTDGDMLFLARNDEVVAIDALAVFVNKDNPIKFLTIAQVDAIFSSTRKCGGEKDIAKWGDLGLTGAWASRGLQLYGRNSVSGTYGYFKENALCKGDFKPSVNEQPGSASVVQSVGTSVNAIGYSGPISVEWEDAGMDRLVGAAEAVGFVRRLAFDAPEAAFDAAFSSGD